jgi:hypothetical protein
LSSEESSLSANMSCRPHTDGEDIAGITQGPASDVGSYITARLWPVMLVKKGVVVGCSGASCQTAVSVEF